MKRSFYGFGHGASVLVLSAVLAGCAAPVVLGVTAVGTGLVVVDRRSSGTQLEDETIELKAANRISDAFGTRARISVTSFNRRVLLTGEALNETDRQQIQQVVLNVENVRAVVNELAIANSPSLTQQATDTVLTAKVKASFVDAKDLSTNAFKVVTERGTVYLMGLVTRREADRATEIAKSTGGVKGVVRIFEYLTEEDLLRLQPAVRDDGATSSK